MKKRYIFPMALACAVLGLIWGGIFYMLSTNMALAAGYFMGGAVLSAVIVGVAFLAAYDGTSEDDLERRIKGGIDVQATLLPDTRRERAPWEDSYR